MGGQVSHVLNVIGEDVSIWAEGLRTYGEISWLSPGKAFDIALIDDPTPPEPAAAAEAGLPETAPAAPAVSAEAAASDTDEPEDETGDEDAAGPDETSDPPTEAEIVLQNAERMLYAARGAAEAAGAVLDINLVATEARRKKLFVADMDSTIITCECLDELADFAGLKAEIAAITERAMRGEIPFDAALRERVGQLAGLPLDTLERVWRERIRLTGGARQLVATMKAHGARALLVSGGFTYFTERVAAAAGFDGAQANRLLDDGEKLTGAVGEPILGRAAKLAALETETARLGLDFAETMATGDGANDLAMIKRSGLGVAFHAKPLVAKIADVRIDHADLRALLYLQGYRDEEIVA